MKHKVIAGILLLSTAIVLLALPQHAATRSPSNSQGQNAPAPAPAMDMSLPTEPTPAFHTQLPRTPLPATLDPTLFTTTVVQNAYIVAARIKKLLYQQPCYCHCDRSEGHGSLLDCFAGHHGSMCNVCMAEDFYTYEQSRAGKTAPQIRAGIVNGDWRAIDLNKYTLPLTAK